MAAGLSAIFRSPMGTGVFAIEVLYGNMEFEGRGAAYYDVFLGGRLCGQGLVCGLCAAISDSIYPRPPGRLCRVRGPGLAAGAIGTLLPVVFYRVARSFFECCRCRYLDQTGARRPWASGYWPCGFPRSCKAGTAENPTGHQWPARPANPVVVSGICKNRRLRPDGFLRGSGGVFAPSLFVGAMLGGSSRSCSTS